MRDGNGVGLKVASAGVEATLCVHGSLSVGDQSLWGLRSLHYVLGSQTCFATF